MISIHKNILSVDALLSNAFTLTGQTHWEYTCPNNIFSGLNSWTMDGGTGGAYLRITNYELRITISGNSRAKRVPAERKRSGILKIMLVVS